MDCERMTKKFRWVTGLMLVMLTLFAGCSSRHSANRADWVGYTEKGQATYYADKHQNRRTASGDVFRQDQRTAAHRDMPFGTKVRVTNLSNGRSVVVLVNDRGPFVRGRIMDLSKSAFRSISSLSAGIIDVKIEVIR
jgi:rare lipoprotein A